MSIVAGGWWPGAAKASEAKRAAELGRNLAGSHLSPTEHCTNRRERTRAGSQQATQRRFDAGDLKGISSETGLCGREKVVVTSTQ